MLTATGDPRVSGFGHVWDDYPPFERSHAVLSGTGLGEVNADRQADGFCDIF